MISDDSGIVDMPFRIMVSLAVICVMAPIVVSLTDTAEETAELAPAVSEAKILKNSISRAYYGGIGTIESVELELDPGISIQVGGDEGESYAIRILDSGRIADRVYLDRPSVRILEPLTISGRCTVMVECAVIDGILGVRISI